MVAMHQMLPLPQVAPMHVCNKSFAEIENYEEDLIELIATCQRHTRCSPSYTVSKQNMDSNSVDLYILNPYNRLQL